jgi:hypothetical protein
LRRRFWTTTSIVSADVRIRPSSSGSNIEAARALAASADPKLRAAGIVACVWANPSRKPFPELPVKVSLDGKTEINVKKCLLKAWVEFPKLAVIPYLLARQLNLNGMDLAVERRGLLNAWRLIDIAVRCDSMFAQPLILWAALCQGENQCFRRFVVDGKNLDRKEVLLRATILDFDDVNAWELLVEESDVAEPLEVVEGKVVTFSDALLEAIRCDPTKPALYHRLSRLAHKYDLDFALPDGRVMGRKEALVEALKHDPKNSQYRLELADALGRTETVTLSDGSIANAKGLYKEVIADRNYQGELPLDKLARVLDEGEAVEVTCWIRHAY